MNIGNIKSEKNVVIAGDRIKLIETKNDNQKTNDPFAQNALMRYYTGCGSLSPFLLL